MPLLTIDRLEPARLTYYYDIIRRGQAYYSEGRVSLKSFDGESATATVQGTRGQCTVTIKATPQGRPALTCTCPHAAKGNICKHMIAAALAVREHIRSIQNRWDYRLHQALERIPAPKKEALPSEPYILLYSLRPESSYSPSPPTSFRPPVGPARLKKSRIPSPSTSCWTPTAPGNRWSGRSDPRWNLLLASTCRRKPSRPAIS